jgi:hypothetical protein
MDNCDDRDAVRDERAAFMKMWERDYPETAPIDFLFKIYLTKRWIRVYSLHEGHRYPEDELDWNILLSRQNTVIDYLVPQGTPITWVFNWLENDNHIFKSFDLIPLGGFTDKDYLEGELESWMLKAQWESGLFNTFLMMIANEEVMRAFIIAPNCLIAPYEGGMDIVLKDPHTADAFKRHFADWVSPRQDGL